LFWEWAKSTIDEVTSCWILPKPTRTCVHRLYSLVRVMYTASLPWRWWPCHEDGLCMSLELQLRTLIWTWMNCLHGW
jgi:hypothetical protein